MDTTPQLSLILAGPILRRVSPAEMTLWLVTTREVEVKLKFSSENMTQRDYALTRNSKEHECLHLSPSLKYQMINLHLSKPLPTDCTIQYELLLRRVDATNAEWQDITELLPHLCYPGQDNLQLYIPSRVNALLHGSCRKPHYSGIDGLVVADNHLENLITQAGETDKDKWPSMLVMSGDQIYADDVAGPMLHAIHQLTTFLSFPLEQWETDPDGGSVMTTEQLYQHPSNYYRRSHLLPHTEVNRNLVKVLFGGARKPVFTSTHVDNHLITLGEYLACYLLSWSPTPWSFTSLETPEGLDADQQLLYSQERELIESFISGLAHVQRVMAHLPVAMIMDDHDITDDFNLHRNWEETVYSHPLSKRMIGNGMLAYLINQAWGNQPEAFNAQLFEAIQNALNNPCSTEYDTLLHRIIRLEAWDFDWPTNPPLIVLDTRTRRWRSEKSAYQPSGILDWEALTELQNRLSGHSSVLLVSAAPIFGVKIIEVLQRIVTFFGHPLAVDAEYWMGHPGTAHGILNVFCHRQTPHHFVVLSGDVHYSFVYDIELRGQRNSPHIWQICSSGLHNTFPEPLLGILDKLNRWLYSPRSPLNWFTRRRKMRITPRKPLGSPPGRRLLNQSGIGLVELDESGRPIKISQLTGANQSVIFEKRVNEASWH